MNQGSVDVLDFPVVMLGDGGHARVLIYTLECMGAEIINGPEDGPAGYQPASRSPRVHLVNGIGSVGDTQPRRDIFERFKKEGRYFAQVVHPSAIISDDTEIYEGVQIMAGAVIQPGVSIGENSIINTGAIVDHDCKIGAHTHIAPGVTLSGGVRVGDGVHIGTGATVIQGVTIGDASMVAAGAVVIRPVGFGVRVAGVPARVMALLTASR